MDKVKEIKSKLDKIGIGEDVNLEGLNDKMKNLGFETRENLRKGIQGWETYYIYKRDRKSASICLAGPREDGSWFVDGEIKLIIPTHYLDNDNLQRRYTTTSYTFKTKKKTIRNIYDNKEIAIKKINNFIDKYFNIIAE